MEKETYTIVPVDSHYIIVHNSTRPIPIGDVIYDGRHIGRYSYDEANRTHDLITQECTYLYSSTFFFRKVVAQCKQVHKDVPLFDMPTSTGQSVDELARYASLKEFPFDPKDNTESIGENDVIGWVKLGDAYALGFKHGYEKGFKEDKDPYIPKQVVELEMEPVYVQDELLNGMTTPTVIFEVPKISNNKVTIKSVQ